MANNAYELGGKWDFGSFPLRLIIIFVILLAGYSNFFLNLLQRLVLRLGYEDHCKHDEQGQHCGEYEEAPLHEPSLKFWDQISVFLCCKLT